MEMIDQLLAIVLVLGLTAGVASWLRRRGVPPAPLPRRTAGKLSKIWSACPWGRSKPCIWCGWERERYSGLQHPPGALYWKAWTCASSMRSRERQDEIAELELLSSRAFAGASRFGWIRAPSRHIGRERHSERPDA